MTLEVARRLADDGITWETVVVDEDTGGNGGSTVTEITPVSISPSDIQAAESVPITIAPSPGAGKAIIDATLLFVLEAGFGTFGGAFSCSIDVTTSILQSAYGTPGFGVLASALQGGAADDLVYYSLTVQQSGDWSGPISLVTDAPLILWVTGATPTGGAGVVTVVGSTTIVTLAP